jgi:hypothetical protein
MRLNNIIHHMVINELICRALAIFILCAGCLIGCRFYYPIKFKIDSKFKNAIFYESNLNKVKISGSYMHAGGRTHIFLEFKFDTEPPNVSDFNDNNIEITGVNVIDRKLFVDKSDNRIYRFRFAYYTDDIPMETLSLKTIHIGLLLPDSVREKYGIDLRIPDLPR